MNMFWHQSWVQEGGPKNSKYENKHPVSGRFANLDFFSCLALLF